MRMLTCALLLCCVMPGCGLHEAQGVSWGSPNAMIARYAEKNNDPKSIDARLRKMAERIKELETRLGIGALSQGAETSPSK